MAQLGAEPASTTDLWFEAQLVVPAAPLAKPCAVVLCRAACAAASCGGSAEGIVEGGLGYGLAAGPFRACGIFRACGNDRGHLVRHFQRFWLRLPLSVARVQRAFGLLWGSCWWMLGALLPFVFEGVGFDVCCLWLHLVGPKVFLLQGLGAAKGACWAYFRGFCLLFRGSVGLTRGTWAFSSRLLPSISRVSWVVGWWAHMHGKHLRSGKRQGLWAWDGLVWLKSTHQF